MRRFAAAAAGACAANATWWMQPILIGYLITNASLSAPLAGLLVSAEMAALAATSALIVRFAPHWEFRKTGLLGMGLAIIASIATLGLHQFVPLLIARCLAGAGVGAALVVSNRVVAGFDDPDKAFARINVVNLIFGALIVGLAPLLHGVSVTDPYAAILLALLALSVAMALLPKLRPPAANPEQAVGAPVGPLVVGPALVALMAITLIVGISSGTLWAFYGIIGGQAGLSVAQVDGAISLAIVAAIAGSAIGGLIGVRFGRLAPVLAALAIMTIGISMLASHPSAAGFRVATCANLAALYFVLPYVFGAAAALDTSGRGVSYVGGIFYFTGAVSPVLGGYLERVAGIEVVGAAVFVGSAIASLLFVYVQRLAKTAVAG
ncbi:MFS transporter [Caulobacter sp. AP07]|uniref:MFS transporter n=1 Tax=Caulobacter sp. AP07 TaxID=1144304 RepID=UPI000551E2CB|nr:MFS transporter [Caulobacter sp. AP07]